MSNKHNPIKELENYIRRQLLTAVYSVGMCVRIGLRQQSHSRFWGPAVPMTIFLAYIHILKKK
jgi:hypothetical protein